MNLSDEIRKQIEKNKGLKLAVGEINNHLSILEELVRKDIEERKNEAYQQGLEEGYERGLTEGKKAFDLLDAERDAEYQRGLEDAWECAKKLFSSMADSDIEKAFPIEWNNGGFKALMNLQPQEAIAKLKAYEEKQKVDAEIKVGDEVKWEGVNFTVLRVFTPKGCYGQCDGFDCDGNGYTNILTKDVTKTGRHFDIDKILEEMKE